MAAPHTDNRSAELNMPMGGSASLLAPVQHNILVYRDAWCPGDHDVGINCLCEPTVVKVDEPAWMASLLATQLRAPRRKAVLARAVGAQKTGSR
jgi:hypothetical protein